MPDADPMRPEELRRSLKERKHMMDQMRSSMRPPPTPAPSSSDTAARRQFRKRTVSAAPPVSPAAAVQEELQLAAENQGVVSATGLMFPWERRQMGAEDGAGLYNWEKVYWVAFGLGIAFLVATNGYAYFTGQNKPKEEPAVDEGLEDRKREAALLIARGGSTTPEGEDPFQGWAPAEIEAFVVDTVKSEKLSRARGYIREDTVADPYEGLSPEEIDRLSPGAR